MHTFGMHVNDQQFDSKHAPERLSSQAKACTVAQAKACTVDQADAREGDMHRRRGRGSRTHPG